MEGRGVWFYSSNTTVGRRKKRNAVDGGKKVVLFVVPGPSSIDDDDDDDDDNAWLEKLRPRTPSSIRSVCATSSARIFRLLQQQQRYRQRRRRHRLFSSIRAPVSTLKREATESSPSSGQLVFLSRFRRARLLRRGTLSAVFGVTRRRTSGDDLMVVAFKRIRMFCGRIVVE